MPLALPQPIPSTKGALLFQGDVRFPIDVAYCHCERTDAPRTYRTRGATAASVANSF